MLEYGPDLMVYFPIVKQHDTHFILFSIPSLSLFRLC
jgi:hypothetical protein